MAIEFKKTSYDGYMPTIWRGECKILPGGFKPVQSFATGTVLRRGTPILVDFETMTAGVVKAAKVEAGGTTAKPRVTKNSHFSIGDKVMSLGGEDQKTVSNIDTSNSAYDVLTLSGAITGLAEGDILQESEEVETVIQPRFEAPNMIVGADLEFTGRGIPTIDAAYEAVVLYNIVSYPLVDDWMLNGGPCLKLNPNIVFIKQ